jgi:hypothetical protein
MQIELNGKEFRLRCDMRALANAKRESNIDIGNLGDDVVEVGTFVYYMAQSGAKHAGVEFKYELDDFLGLIEIQDLETLGTAITSLMGGGAEKKR